MKRVTQVSSYEIFPKLPDELGHECLMRVPYEWHGNLRAVSKRWKEVVNSPQFYRDRKRCGKWEQCICLIEHYSKVTVFYPSQNRCRRLPPIPVEFNVNPHMSECVCVSDKLILLGGFVPDPNNLAGWKLSDIVLMFNFSSNQWLLSVPMRTPRANFACSVSPEGHIYIAGGQSESIVEREAAVYDTEENRWELLPLMKQRQPRCCGAFLDGKFFVITHGPAQVFDVKTKTWTFFDDLRRHSFRAERNVLTAHGRLYFFEGVCVREYNCKENVVKRLDFSPPQLTDVKCIAMYGENVFVCGRDSWGNMICFIYRLPTIQATIDEDEQHWIGVEVYPRLLDNFKFYKAGVVHI
ncbi:hypothetical protein KI387_010377 [Taxus chinensis]|uniref:F-box domain-containing protein n=1 Tax=Taxus chinensis TaxID=29808 RepID=A0AA38KF71_TAXCH|nr:hypothetical protein KI387_010377 [Taxus chinensis]